MRAVIQRVTEAAVIIDSQSHAAIGPGFLILLGIEAADAIDDIQWLCRKISTLRVFGDEQGNMNLALNDVGGELLVVSQFTLHASTRKGNRPSFIKAARPDIAVPLYEEFLATLTAISDRPVKSGVFGAHMQISSINDGPVTIIMDTILKE